MKPFDLEAAQRGEALITRSGAAITFIAYVKELTECQVLAHFEGVLYTFNKAGQYYGDEDPCNHDLFMAPKKKTVWVNIYSDSFRPSDSFASGYIYETEIIADANSEKHRFGGRAWPMEIEE